MSILSQTKQVTKNALIKTKALRSLNSIYHKYVAILKYHSIQNDPKEWDDSIEPGIITPTESFRRHMEILRSQFNPVTMDDIILFLKGEKEFPKRAVAVTFDDGFDEFRCVVMLILVGFIFS